jgi:tripartite-type tricarboxylate transporter receptor subunit TctC
MIRTLLSFTALAFAVGTTAHAQAPAPAAAYPTKPIRLIVPFPPGGGTDSVSRLVAQELQKSTGWTVVVENKAGAGGMIGLQEAARARNDGYDIVMGQVDNMVIAPAVQRTGQLDPIKELTPVIQVATSPFLFMAATDSKYKTLNDWVSEAKANPGKLSYGTAGYGTFTHLAVELLQKAGNFKATQIPYKGAAPAITDVLGGQIPMAALSIASGMPHIQGGKVRGLAVTSAQRSPALPDVPTVAESGLPGFEAMLHFGLLAPAATPRSVIDGLNGELKTLLVSEEVKKRIAADGGDPFASTPAEYEAYIARETAKWSALIRRLDLKVD